MVCNLAFDVFEDEAKEVMGGKFQVHPGPRNEYIEQVKALYEKVRRGDVVRTKRHV
jgi:hypothetical protein